MKILIATDGSDFSNEALETIGQMVKNAENAELKIVSAYEQAIMVSAAPYAVYTAENPLVEKEMRELATQAVAQAERKIRERFPALQKNLSTRVLCGSPQMMIVEEAESWGADLIVVGSHGYGFWERVFLGSVSSAIVHHAPCSVMVVRKPKRENGTH